ncbi:hypothetical protein ACS0TY_008181 [Phlomoides rotata]
MYFSNIIAMARICRRKTEVLLVVEEIILEIVFMLTVFINIYRNMGQFRGLNVENLRRYRMVDRIPQQIEHMSELVETSDIDCFDNLRLNREAFNRLYVIVGEQVALFLSVLSHHSKVRVVKFSFKRSGQTIHTYFHNVLRAVLKLHEVLLAKPSLVTDDCTHLSWKHFKGCLGALDGTLIDVTVPETDKARYRTRKGTVSVNVLAACDRGMCFMYMLAGWEGLAADARVLRDAIARNDGLRVPRDKKQQYYDTKVPKM